MIGAFVLVLLEEVLQSYTDYWLLGVGIFIIIVVLLLPHGLTGLFAGRGKQPVEPEDLSLPPAVGAPGVAEGRDG